MIAEVWIVDMDYVCRIDVDEGCHVLAGQDAVGCWPSVVILNHPVVDLVAFVCSGADSSVVSAISDPMRWDDLQLRKAIV